MDAKKEVGRALKELQQIGEFYSTVGSALRADPPRLRISNAGFSVRAPIAYDGPGVDYTKWPEKATVKEKLKAFYDAEFAYAQAWHGLPPDERGQFPEPRP
jgi:hypothetical protein